jgi:hypothetical protein
MRNGQDVLRMITKIDLDCAVALAAAADTASALRQFVPELNALKSAGEL